MPQTAPTIAYIAEGKLYTQNPSEPAKLIDSVFVQTILDRVEKNRSRNEWKSQGMAWNFASRGGGNPFGMGAAPAEVRRIRFSGVAGGGQAKELLYAIDTDFAGGLFHHDLADASERRLYHRNQFRATDLSRHAHDGTLTFTVQQEDGTAHIATMAAEGRGFKEVTEGDSVDEAPTWVPGAGHEIVFQSAGIGRNQHGVRVSLSPYAIQRIDLDDDKMDTLLEPEDYDALLPRMSEDGTLYFIRRPYQPFGQPVSLLKVGLDVLLFPYRLVRAIVHFFNFFSMMFSKKPLITAGGPLRDGPDARFLMLWGQVIDTNKALRNAKANDGGSLVPGTWQLIKRTASGVDEILAKHVLSYDLCRDGSVVFTDGVKITHLGIAGDVKEIGSGNLIERVAVIDRG